MGAASWKGATPHPMKRGARVDLRTRTGLACLYKMLRTKGGCMTTSRQLEWNGTAGVRHIIHVAWPLILSNAFWMAQISIDRILLSRDNPDAVGAAMMAAMLFW